MADDRRDVRRPDYHHARVGAAAALVSVVVFILIVDTLSLDYEASPIILAGLLGTIGALMGIEIRADWRK